MPGSMLRCAATADCFPTDDVIAIAAWILATARKGQLLVPLPLMYAIDDIVTQDSKCFYNCLERFDRKLNSVGIRTCHHTVETATYVKTFFAARTAVD
jgi:hypothetical protein